MTKEEQTKLMNEMQADYPLIPITKITDEAKLLAIAWVEGYEYQGMDIPGKQKLASDIMNYARRKYTTEIGSLARMRETLEKIANNEGVYCIQCAGEGNIWADGKEHRETKRERDEDRR